MNINRLSLSPLLAETGVWFRQPRLPTFPHLQVPKSHSVSRRTLSRVLRYGSRCVTIGGPAHQTSHKPEVHTMNRNRYNGMIFLALLVCTAGCKQCIR